MLRTGSGSNKLDFIALLFTSTRLHVVRYYAKISMSSDIVGVSLFLEEGTVVHVQNNILNVEDGHSHYSERFKWLAA
ncbi:hypothetical protein J6590_099443 [Homalodisca vitripennis]|nr:hypothetical protein J6590_099443 [Homalodisca vitripennis]